MNIYFTLLEHWLPLAPPWDSINLILKKDTFFLETLHSFLPKSLTGNISPMMKKLLDLSIWVPLLVPSLSYQHRDQLRGSV